MPDSRFYLERVGTKVPQFRASRSGRMVTAIVIHDTESIVDMSGPDTGAERVASFIQGRSDAGSYHVLVDSDSIVELVGPDRQAFHCRGGVNQWSLGVSFACKSTDWPTMPAEYRARMLRNGARAVARLALWIESGQPPSVYPPRSDRPHFPIRWVNADQARAGWLGLTTHGELDPTRRSDPGVTFPRVEFLALVVDEVAALRGTLAGPDETKEDDMANAKVWNLVDLGAIMDSIDELYAAHRADPIGANGWRLPVVELLRAGKDPGPTLAFVDWALSNPAEAAKLR